MTKISVIIPVYNTEKYLEKCLDSVIKQTLMDIEIICINDGSLDNSSIILERYAQRDKRIKIINKQNEGQAIARNLGIEIATGEYLGFIDSDDWVDLNYFEKLYNAAEKYNCDMACSGYKRCKSNSKRIRKKYEVELICTTTNDKVRLDNLPSDNYIWNKIYKRETWLNNNIKFQQGRYFEDIALVIKILDVMGKMIMVPDTYYNYRVNPNSTVNQKSKKHKSDYNWAVEELYKYAEEKNITLCTANILKQKECYKLFNLTIFKNYYYESKVVYKLFGFIPFIKKIIL